ncbi:glycosyltransferase family 4 protein [Bacillus sp. UMB0893]|uniref:glycosyltransferase family 4 protein n=1 Tax=Bacillus sp. UMB0893 TaxID=2066053 RepID=UPI000C761E59|nr:glycosyltransferase family 4 protein [Bacillus sp. UMB0893]PLR67961.1 hypothetical protein CYJ36_11640 [Bacillus sp. UMB0893]
MKIIYITQHFPPEIGAAQGRAFDMSNNLAKLGHELHVLTTFPNHIDTNKFLTIEKVSDLTVYRSFRTKDTKKSSLNRLSNYLSFMLSSFFTGLRIKKPDVIYATSPQLFQGVTGYLLSRFHRAKFVFEIRDLWVDFAEILGQFNNKKLLSLARKLERFLYKKADMIVVVTYGYKERLLQMGISEHKVIVIPNGVNPNSLNGPREIQLIKEQYNIQDKFLVLYAGNLGIAQGLKTVINAAEILKNDHSIVFMFIGEGAEKNELMELSKSLNLSNIIFLDSRNKKELDSYYQAADIGLVSLKKHPLFEITIPSKIFDYMAMSTPVLIGVDGEARNIIEKNEAGYFYEPDSADSLVTALKYAQQHPDDLIRMRKTLKNKLLTFYNREKQAAELELELTKLVKK